MDNFNLKLFNSLSGKIDNLKLHPDKTFNLYLCGPTVYDYVHVGNLRPTIVLDVLHRLLLHLGLPIKYVQNITDVDDKIIQKALKEKRNEKEITEYYTKAYLQDLVNYNILQTNLMPKVTEYIEEIQKFIANLLKKGYAYQKQGNVIFRLNNQPRYGQLSKQKLEKLHSDKRIIKKIEKESAFDFVLWKKTGKGISWDSPWGKGRPGWHTECVVFINKLFEEKTIDVHAGGIDLKFPHHENERIQLDKELSKIWLHFAHIHWKSEKMSKSLGNALLAKKFYSEYGANVFRFLVLNTRYNQTINLEKKIIIQAADYIEKIDNLLKRTRFYLYLKNIKLPRANRFKEKKTLIKKKVVKSLLDNLNTVKSLYVLEETIYSLNKSLDKNEKKEKIIRMVENLLFVLNLLGFKFNLSPYSIKVKRLISKWEELKKNKQYLEGDKIRKQLQEMKIV